MRLVGLVAAAAFLLAAVPGPTLAADRAAGWAKWADHAERIIAAVDSDSAAAIRASCDGVTRTVIGQGFQFPYWAQSLIQACDALKAATKESDSRRRKGQVCSDMKRVGRNLAKAEPVAEEPRAAPAAHRLSQLLLVNQAAACG
jgi:hypothetical protein